MSERQKKLLQRSVCAIRFYCHYYWAIKKWEKLILFNINWFDEFKFRYYKIKQTVLFICWNSFFQFKQLYNTTIFISSSWYWPYYSAVKYLTQTKGNRRQNKSNATHSQVFWLIKASIRSRRYYMRKALFVLYFRNRIPKNPQVLNREN